MARLPVPRVGLKVTERVCRRAVDADLEVEVVAEAVPGAADVADHLALADAAGGQREARLVRVAGGDACTVVDAGVVPVAAVGRRERDRARLRGTDRGSRWNRNVDPGVQPAPAHPERGDNGTVDRPDETGCALTLDRAGGERGPRRGLPGLKLGLDLSLEVADVALKPLLRLLDLVERPLLAVAHGVKLGLAGLELHPGALELRLASRDLVARRLDALHRVTGLVAQAANAIDDRRVLLLDPPQVLVAVQHVVEAVGVQDHRQRIRLVRFVDRNQAVGEDAQRAVQGRLQDLKTMLLSAQARPDLLELLLDDRLAVAQRGDLAGDLVDALAVAGDIGREHALLLLDPVELGALGVE